jgi:RNA recognition motif-containing protein
MYMQPFGQPQGVAQPLVSGAYPINTTYSVMPPQLVYAPQMVMAPYPVMAPVQAATPVYAVAPPRPQKNKGNAVLFVGQLNYDVTEKDVRELFSYYGRVVNVVLLKDSKRGNAKPDPSEPKNNKHVVGSSAFVTFPTTAEADLAIMSLHGRYCMDSRDKPVQVSYCQKTDIISDFGYRHALQLHAENPANPIPSISPTPSVAYAIKFA